MPIGKRIRGTERRGIAFPIEKGTEGYWPRRNAAALRRTSIAMIMGTTPGERVGVPEFGSRLRFLTFEPNDTQLLNSLREATVEALSRWDPFIQLVGVATEVNDNQVVIYIDYIDLGDEKQRVNRYTHIASRS